MCSTEAKCCPKKSENLTRSAPKLSDNEKDNEPSVSGDKVKLAGLK